MLLGLLGDNSDNLSVYINGYTPIAPFRENTFIRFQLLSHFIDTVIIDKEIIFYL